MNVPVGETAVHLSWRRIVFGLLLVGLVGYGGYGYTQQSQALSDAVAVQATVTDAGIDRREAGRGIEYVPRIEYTYQYRGETYVGDQVFPGTRTPRYDRRLRAQSVVDPYATGTTVRAYVVPGTPSEAFLIPERTPWPLRAVGLGAAGLLLLGLDSLGSRTPGRETDLRTESDATSPSTLGMDAATVHRVAVRLIVGCSVAGFVSLVALVAAVLNAAGGIGGPAATLQADLFGPVGLSALAAAVSFVGLLCAVCLYGAWSFTEYRRLRARIRGEAPPSPFRHPSRLVTILRTRHDDLSEYGRRVRLTGFTFVTAGVLLFVLAEVLSTPL